MIKKKNGANCLQLAPFGVVTSARQISTKILDDLKQLAYYG
ncbi:hypothetical protein [Flavobacterium anhuiense]